MSNIVIKVDDTRKVNNKLSGFTDDQKKAYDSLIEFIQAPYDSKDCKRALCGPAGTGKTYLVRALITNCGLAFSKIGLAAPTHKACRVLSNSIGISQIKVNTLQSDLGLRLNLNVENFDINNPPFDPRGKVKIKNYSIYIIDESSMIPDLSKGRRGGLKTYLEKVCAANKCKIIYIGDDYQLPPVNEKYSAAFQGIKIHFLRQVVRQDDDNPVKILLNLLRYDIEHKQHNFLNMLINTPVSYNVDYTKGYECVRGNDFARKIYTYFSDERLTKDVDYCKVVGYTNNNVIYWNNFIRNNIIADSNKSIITKNDLILSYVSMVDEFNALIIKNSEDYVLKDIVNFSHTKYDLKGFMVRFIAVYGGKVTQPFFILDHTDPYSLNRYVQISRELIDTASKARSGKAQHWSNYYKFKESCLLLTDIKDLSGKKIFSRDLDYGFAVTAHKSQGSTFDSVFVDVRDIVFDKYGQPRTDIDLVNRLLYVACSRCKNKLFLNY